MFKEKKVIILFASILLVMSFAFSLVSCTSYTDTDSGKLKVLGTVFPQYDFARQIGKEKIDCDMLLRPGADSHSYTGDDPSDILRILNSDLFIYVGGESDSEWVASIKEAIEDSGERCPVFLSMCDLCEVMTENSDGIVEAENEDGRSEEEYDEHVWTSPKNAIRIINGICEAMCQLDVENSEYYKNNCREYCEEISGLDERFSEMISASDTKTLVFADRFPFRYFADEFGLNCYAAFNGCASQSEPAPTTIVELCNIVNSKYIRYIFYIETSQSGVPDSIVKKTGCGKLLLHSCHTVTEKELNDGATYLSLMENNYKNLRKALNDE